VRLYPLQSHYSLITFALEIGIGFGGFLYALIVINHEQAPLPLARFKVAEE
jgi:hypothetical protein